MGKIARQTHVVRFGHFELDLRAGELRKQGVRIKLQEQPFQVLALLLENCGQAVTREELRQKIWPADTFVDFDHGLNAAINKIREALGDSADKPRFVETLPRRGYRFVGAIETTAPRIESLAVLPLENLSCDPEQEYFAEGMTEALITTLAKIGALRVVSRTTAMYYKGVHRPVREIAKELQVDVVVEGTVLRSGDRVRISAQLVDAHADTHLWAEVYDRNMRDVLALQSEVAQAIAREIQVKLTPLEKAQLAQASPMVPEAYEAYLKGRYYWNRRSQDAFPKGVQFFEEAIAKDPGFAAAYAGLSDCLCALGSWSVVAPEEVYPKNKKMALRALELDPGLSEGHASIAWVKTWHEYDFKDAEKEFERSIELNPRYPTAHSWFGFFLGNMGRFDEALTECKRAIRLDPLSMPIQWATGWVYTMARRYDESIAALEKVLEFDPDFSSAHVVLGYPLLQKSLYPSAVNALERAVKLSPRSTMYLSVLGEVYARSRRPEEALRILDRLRELSSQQYVSPYYVARLHLALGNRDEALTLLETAYRERVPSMLFLKTDSLLDDLRSDPRFQDLLCRMNFPG